MLMWVYSVNTSRDSYFLQHIGKFSMPLSIKMQAQRYVDVQLNLDYFTFFHWFLWKYTENTFIHWFMIFVFLFSVCYFQLELVFATSAVTINLVFPEKIFFYFQRKLLLPVCVSKFVRNPSVLLAIFFLYYYSFMFLQYGNAGCGIFKWGGIKLERVLPKNQHISKGNFENWANGEPQ